MDASQISLRNSNRWIGAALFLLSLALGLYRIDNQSVWLDEALSLSFVRPAWVDLTRSLVSDFVHPPLHYYLLKGWLTIFGFGTFQARLFSAVLESGAVVALFGLGRALFDRRSGTLAALLLAFSQLAVMHAQEIRPYALLLFLVVLGTFLCVKALQERSVGLWWGFTAAATAMIYTHYYAIFIVGCLILYAMMVRRSLGIPFWWVLGASMLPMVLFAPWVASGIVEQAAGSNRTFQQQPWLTAHWWSVLAAVNRFNNGKLFGIFGPTPWWVYLAGFGLFTTPALVGLWKVWAGPKQGWAEGSRATMWLLAGLWNVPLLTTVFIGLYGIPYDVRYVAHCAPFYYLLVAVGMLQLGRRGSLAIAAAALCFSIFSLRSVYFIPYKENMKDSLLEMARDARPGDCALTLTGELPHQWWIYVKNSPELRLVSLEEVETHPANCRRVWLTGIRRVEARGKILDERRRRLESIYDMAEERHYFWFDVYLFVAPNPAAAGAADSAGPRPK